MARGKSLRIQSTLTVFLIFFALSFLTLFLDKRGFFEGLHRAVQGATIPLRESLYQTKQAALLPFEFIREYKRVNQRIVTLENDVAVFSSRIGELGSLREENKRMKSLLSTNLPATWKFELGRVVGSSSDELFLISPGYTPQVSTPIIIAERDEPQTGDRGVYIGKAEKIIGEETIGILPTSTLSKIGVIVRSKESGERRGTGIVIGTGGAALLDQVLSGEEITEGDLIVTSGEGKLPSELLLGYVGRVRQDKSSPWKQAEVQLPVKRENLENVFFVSKY